VDFVTGFRCELEALGDFCKRKGILLCVDAIQSLGIIPMDVKKYGIHFLAAGGHKWLMSTMGAGGLFISKDVNDLIHPERVGWKSVMQEQDFFQLQFDLKPDALRFEPGTMNVTGIYALGAAIDLLLEVRIENAFKQVLAINDLICEGLNERNVRIATPMARGERSGILSFIPPSDPKTLYRYLIQKNIMVSLRDHMIRLSPHFYNNRNDVERFLQVLDSFHS
jgi:selenocysteine lyase/cysteine desulfurase